MFILDGYCSFKDAIDRLGRAKFPNEWTGEEFDAELLPIPSERAGRLERELDELCGPSERSPHRSGSRLLCPKTRAELWAEHSVPKYKAQPVEGPNIIEHFPKPAMGA